MGKKQQQQKKNRGQLPRISSEPLIYWTPMDRSSFVFGLGFIVTLFVHCFPNQFREVF